MLFRSLANNAPADQTLEQKKILPQEKASNKLSNKKAKLKATPPETVPERSDIAQNSNNSKVQTTKIADSRISQQKANLEIVRVSVKSNRIHQCLQAQVAMSQCN